MGCCPNYFYTDNAGNKAWLSFPAADGLSVVTLPKSDPYKEIYLAKDVFYRLVNPEWLAPGSSQLKPSKKAMETPWDKFSAYLEEAKLFHVDLQSQTHSQTYQFYSEGLNTADRIVFRRHAYDWKSKGKRLLEIIKADFPGRATISAAGTPLLGFNPVTFVVTGAVSAAIKDSDFMVNRGGFRCYTHESDLDTPKESADALFVMQIEMPGRRSRPAHRNRSGV